MSDLLLQDEFQLNVSLINQTCITDRGGKRFVSKANSPQLIVDWFVPNGQADNFEGISFPKYMKQ